MILSTGTSLVPELPFTLEAGDEVRITISGIAAHWSTPWYAVRPISRQRRTPPGEARPQPRPELVASVRSDSAQAGAVSNRAR